MNPNNLAELKDIHTPGAISVFPIAPGWYILAILVLIATISLIYWQRKRIERRAKIANILNLLSAIEERTNVNSSDNSSEVILTEVSILLKRVARDKFPEENSHTLFGDNWLIFLDRTGNTTDFTLGEGRYLRDIYQKTQLKNPELFFTVIKDWLKVVL